MRHKLIISVAFTTDDVNLRNFPVEFIIRCTLQLKNSICHFSKEVSLSSSDFNIIITKPKKKSIQYRTEHSIWHICIYSNITPVNENPFFFSLLLEFQEHLFIQMKMEYMVGYIPPSITRYYKCNARDCSLSLWERISNFFFFCVKKMSKRCVEWGEEYCGVENIYKYHSIARMVCMKN